MRLNITVGIQEDNQLQQKDPVWAKFQIPKSYARKTIKNSIFHVFVKLVHNIEKKRSYLK